MRIVALGFRGFPNVQGGVENHCEHLYPRLVNFGCEVIAFSRASYTGKTPYEYKGVRIIPVWSPRHKTLETFFHTGLCTLLAGKYRPDCIHYHAIGPGFFVPYAKRRGFKTIATHHGFDYERDKWGVLARSFLRMGERQLCKADLVIPVSEHIRESLQKRYLRQCSAIPNGVDLPEMIPAGFYCGKWNVTAGKYFIFAGRIVPEKCVHDLLNAFDAVKNGWKLIIAGNADHESAYSKAIKKQAALNKNVLLTGFVTGIELQELFSNAGCFVLPSSHEGLPIALLEALSFGLPCIVSDIPANKDISHPSVRFFPVHKVAVLTDILNKIADGNSLSDRNCGRSYVSKYFNWDMIAEMTYQKIKQLF